MKPFTLRSWVLHTLFKVYYRFLYWKPIGIKVIDEPKQVFISSKRKIYACCSAELNREGEKHKSFLYFIMSNKTKVFVWRFRKRHFAFSNDGGNVWWEIPALTPWEFFMALRPWKCKTVKYGLNGAFAKKHFGERIVFIAYD